MSEYVMYVAAIKLPPGKLAAQVSHAVLGLYRNITSNMEHAKVILKLENDIDANALLAHCESAGIPRYVVIDAGRTVVAPGTRTAIAFGPVLKNTEGPWNTMKLY